jgi:hypothetical protein
MDLTSIDLERLLIVEPSSTQESQEIIAELQARRQRLYDDLDTTHGELERPQGKQEAIEAIEATISRISARIEELSLDQGWPK